MEIRKAKQGDFLEIHRLDQEVWKQNHKADHIPDGSHTWKIWEVSAIVFVALIDEVIVGVSLAFPTMEQTFCIHKIFVAKELRSQGIGTKLMRALLDKIDNSKALSFLTVDPRNQNALKMYEKLGFVDRKFIKEYYGKDEDRYILTRKANV